MASKDSMRSFYGVDRWDNAYFISENFSEALIEKDFLFGSSVSLATLQALSASPPSTKKIRALPSTGPVSPLQTHLSAQHSQELALIVFGPPIVANNDFVFVLDDL